MIRRQILLLALTFLTMGVPIARAQDFPNKTIRIVNPFPGGPTDAFARLIASKLQAGLKQTVIVEAKAGAGGTIAVTAVSKAAPDGYTLLITSASTQIVQPVVRKTLPYDPLKSRTAKSKGWLSWALKDCPSCPMCLPLPNWVCLRCDLPIGWVFTFRREHLLQSLTG